METCLNESENNTETFVRSKATTLNKVAVTILNRSGEKGREQANLFDDCTFKAVRLWLPVERNSKKDNWFPTRVSISIFFFFSFLHRVAV